MSAFFRTGLVRRAAAFLSSPVAFAAFLLALCLAAYAPLLSRMGFYWDDFPMAWIAATMGGEGLERYFSTNRPVWGLIYRMTTPLLGTQPLTWQIFALLLRWASGLVFWWLLRLVWVRGQHSGPARAAFAAWAAALFVLYPGFSQQFISFLYSHFYIILIAFLLSLSLMVYTLRLPVEKKGWYAALTLASMLLSLLNMLAMEYFFLLDLLRPLLIWIVLGESEPNPHKRLWRTLRLWLPFLLVFGGAMFWRSVLFGFQTYQPALMSRLRADPGAAVLNLIPQVFADVWKTSVGAWMKAFVLPDALQAGAVNMQRYWLLVAAGGSAALVFFLFYRPRAAKDGNAPFYRNWRQGWAWQAAALGVVAMLIAGGPFWLTDLKIGLVFPNDRFTLPFMLGASILAAALLTLIPAPRWARVVLLALGLGFAVGAQFQYAIEYNRDWSVQRSMFWQMTWRMPDLAPGTALLSNELPVTHYTDNSLTAPLNWTYDPQNDPLVMQYALLYPTLRKTDMLSNFAKDQPVYLNYLAAKFTGSTGQMVSFYYNPPGCLRILDPQIDIYNWMVPLYLRESLALSSTEAILAEPAQGKASPRPPAHIYGEEIQHGWCYYFEKADLARQLGEWETVAQLGDEAFASSDYPNDPLERFPFIEGYAHTGNWSQAVTLSRDSYTISPQVMQPMVCRLWERIAQQTAQSAEKDAALHEIETQIGCKAATQ